MTKAIRVHEAGGPEVLRWEDINVPAPGKGEIRVRHTAVGLNYIDVYHRTGLYPMKYPTVIGMEGGHPRRTPQGSRPNPGRTSPRGDRYDPVVDEAVGERLEELTRRGLMSPLDSPSRPDASGRSRPRARRPLSDLVTEQRG